MKTFLLIVLTLRRWSNSIKRGVNNSGSSKHERKVIDLIERSREKEKTASGRGP